MKDIAPKLLIFGILFFCFQSAYAGWHKRSENTLAWLHSVHFSDADTGWIAGSKGTLLSTTDGGKTWIKKSGVTQDLIRQVIFTDSKNGWLLCERDIYSLGNAGASYLLKTEDGGKTWSRIDFKTSQRQRVTKLFFSKNGFGLAVGETGALFGLEDDNRSWKKLTPPSSYLMSGGAFTNDLRGTIVGGGGTILFTDDAGITWNRASVAGRKTSKFNSVFFNDEKVGWAVGSGGMIAQTVNSGKLWRQQRTGTSEKLNDVFFLNSAEGWAIGDGGVMLHTTTAGNIWRNVDLNSDHKLEAIFFSGDHGWVVGFGGLILEYEKEGNSSAPRPRFSDRR
ncbi:MAG: YCF48-related protein [Pyrinomonadaceae bacterium]